MLRFYALLLHLYPRAFRDEYGKEMQLAFRDRWRDEAGVWLALTAIGDVAVNAASVHAEMLWQDVRFGTRTLLRERSFATAAVATLALGIGAATAMYTLLYAVLIKPLPFGEPERVVRIIDTNPKLRIRSFSSSTPNVLSWSERSKVTESIAAFYNQDFNANDRGAPERVRGMIVLGRFWKVLGQTPLAGRAFGDEAHEPGRHRVVLLGEDYWRRRFQGDYGVIGRELQLNGESYSIAGVVRSDTGFQSGIDVFTPLALDAGQRHRGDRRLSVIGRLRAGATREQADAELNRIGADLEREFPGANDGWRVRVLTVDEWLIEPAMRQGLAVLFGAVCLLLMIACGNVANLLVARAAARRREMTVRLALGANRARLVRQLATESLLLGLCGGALGVFLAWATLRLSAPYLPEGLPGITKIGLDAHVLLFSVCISILASLLFGLAPAVTGVGQDGSRGASVESGGAIRKGLVVVQIGLATVLSIGAALTTTTFSRIVHQNFGFHAENLLLARFSPPNARFNAPEKAQAYYDALVAQVSSLPGVVSAGVTSEIPFGPVTTEMPVVPAERADTIRTQGVQTQWRIVTPAYLQTLGVPLLRGRWWAENENMASRPILISQAAVMRLWPEGGDPVGRSIRLGNGRDCRVIGITGDLRQTGMMNAAPEPAMYFPISSFPWETMSLAIRTTADPLAAAAALREAVRRVDPALPLAEVKTMETHLGDVASSPRLAAILFGVFAGLAVLLGAVGIAGLVAFNMSRRRGEFAVRMALGATPGRVAGEVIRSHLVLCGAGLSLGLVSAFALRPVIASLLFGVEPDDWTRYGAVALFLGAVAVLACLIPARRVTAIDPASALRAE